MVYFYNCNVSIKGRPSFLRCCGAAEFSSEVKNKHEAKEKLRKELFTKEVQPFQKDISFSDCHFNFTTFKPA